MAKEIKFNIKLLVDGKEQLVTASTSVAELRKNLDASKDSATRFRESLISVNQAVEALQNFSSSVNNLRNALGGLTASYNAVQQSNTLLETVMRQRIDATDEDIKKVKEVISAQSDLGIISGTVQRMGAQQIATFLTEKGTLEALIPAMNDLVAQQKGISATGEDARGVANLMGKAMMGQTSALRRVGITFTDAQEQIMKFGNEQQRASMLAQIITDNVGHMNAALAKTDAGQLKQLEMSFGAIKVKLGEIATNLMPFVSFTSMALTTATSVISLSRSITGAVKVVQSWSLATKLLNATMYATRASIVGLTAVTRVLRAAFTGATIGATTLKVAIKSLLISTGVGVAVWALSEAIAYLVNVSGTAAGNTKELSAAEEQAKAAKEQEAKQIAEINAALDINISKLKNFKGSKEDEKKIVAEMNNTYGDTMGYYSTVSQWYEALTGNSKAYCAQMINEVRIRDLANKAAELAQKRQDFTHDENGGQKKFSTKRKTRRVAVGQVDAGDGKLLTQYDTAEIKGSSEKEKADAYVTSLYKQEQAARKQMEALVKQNANIKYNQYDGYQKDKPGTTLTKTTGAGTPAKDPKTYVEELQAKLSAAKKEMENATTIEAKVVAETKVNDIQRQIDEATKGKVTIDAETESDYIVQGSDADKRKSRSNAQSKISRIQDDYEIGIIGADKAKKQIDDINAELVKLGVKPIEVHFKTQADELQEQLKDAQREFADATTIDAKIKADAKITELQSQIDKATKGQLTIEVETEPAYIVRGSDADKRQSYSNAQSKAGRIQNDYEIGLIDKDQAQAQIDDLNKQIDGLGANLKPLTLQIDTTEVDQAQQKMQGACDAASAMGSSLSGLGNAIGVPELNIAGTLAQGIATMVQGYAAATKQAAALGPWAWIAFAATGLAQLTAMITAVQGATGFATGGIIGGSSTSGDKKFARVNSGEMILNKFQQARLFSMVNGLYQAPTFYDRSPQPMVMQNVSNIEPSQTMVNIHLNANARKMLRLMSDTKQVTSKSGRRYSV